ncbi:MAG: FecCD family ABC transporter permease, partial [Pontibacterium sp.]
MKRLPFTFVGILLALFTVLVFTYSLVSGPVSLPAYGSLLAAADALLGTELSPFNQVERVIVAELRLPRSLLAFLVGALLAQCGAVMQGLFRNPLADPGIIGVSAGAALGAVVAIALLPASWMDWSLSVGAFLGGLAATSFVYGLSRSPSGTSIIVLLLAGVAIAALAGAVIGVMSYFVDDQQLRDISVWQMGSLSGASLASVGLCLLTLALTTLFFQRYAFALNA